LKIGASRFKTEALDSKLETISLKLTTYNPETLNCAFTTALFRLQKRVQLTLLANGGDGAVAGVDDRGIRQMHQL